MIAAAAAQANTIAVVRQGLAIIALIAFREIISSASPPIVR
jgi:hypothetical protein